MASSPLGQGAGRSLVAGLSITQTVSWGVLYYGFGVFLLPMQAELGYSTSQLSSAFSLALLISAGTGLAVGRYLDSHGPRTLMTLGSLAGALLVFGWSQVDSLLGLYSVWAGMGVVMATVLYEPALTVLAKQFPQPGERRRAMTTLTLVAALASFIFMPLSQALIEAVGWRDALLVLALVMASITVPLHGWLLPSQHNIAPSGEPARAFPQTKEVLHSRSFWLLSTAFFLGALVTVAVIVHGIPFLIDRGHSPPLAALALGLIGAAQIPGRLFYGPISERFSRSLTTALLFVLMGVGIVMVVSVETTWALLAGFVLLGMGNGMATLARATAIADHYGPQAYGSIASVSAALTSTARAVGPLLAALYAVLVGYQGLMWTVAGAAGLAALLAFRAEQSAPARLVGLPRLPRPYRLQPDLQDVHPRSDQLGLARPGEPAPPI